MTRIQLVYEAWQTGRPIPTDPAPSFPELPLRISSVRPPPPPLPSKEGWERYVLFRERNPKREAQKIPTTGPN